jgi:hypothetical protein
MSSAIRLAFQNVSVALQIGPGLPRRRDDPTGPAASAAFELAEGGYLDH